MLAIKSDIKNEKFGKKRKILSTGIKLKSSTLLFHVERQSVIFYLFGLITFLREFIGLTDE